MAPSAGSDDLAWELAAGTDLVLELHLLPSGREETLRARVGLHFARGAAAAPSTGACDSVSRPSTSPAGEAAYREQDALRPAGGGRRARGLSARALPVSLDARDRDACPTDGARRSSTSRAWDFDWQDQYRYRDPIRLPAGTELAMEYVFDNSAGNPRNPHQPPRRVVYGPAASDEMGDLWLQVVAGRGRRRRSPDPRARAPRERVEPGGLARGAGAHARRRDAPLQSRQRAGAHRRARRGNRRARARGRDRSGARACPHQPRQRVRRARATRRRGRAPGSRARGRALRARRGGGGRRRGPRRALQSGQHRKPRSDASTRPTEATTARSSCDRGSSRRGSTRPPPTRARTVAPTPSPRSSAASTPTRPTWRRCGTSRCCADRSRPA